MKKIFSLMTAIFFGAGAFAQCLVTVTGSTNVSCNGDCNGTVSTATVGTAPYTYLWSPGGQTVQNPNNLCAGIHTVTLTDANSCVSTASVTITEPAPLADSATWANIAACDSCNGSATAYPSGGTSPYSHSWSTTPAQTSATASGLCPGTYNDTIRDANNCETILTVTITQAAPISIATTVTNTSSATACDGGATATPSGGTAPFSYLWSPGNQTTSSIIAQCPGNYTVCVTDANNCTTCDSTITILVTGISEVTFESMIHISPNPSQGEFTILFEKMISNTMISVTNILGEKVFQSAVTKPEMKIDLTNQPKGTYLIRIDSDRGSMSKSIVIQ